MRLGSFALVLALAALPFASGCMKPTGGESEPVSHGEEPIINGTAASAYPEAALVDLYQNGQLVGYCSGSVIAPNVVLTAGHCVYQFTSWRIHAPFAGNQSATASSGTTYDWTATGESVDPNMHDLGLIFLNSTISLSSYPIIPSSPLASGSQVVNIGRIRNGQLSTSQLYVSGNITVHNGAQYGYPYDYEAQDVIESGDSGGPDETVDGSHTIVAVNSGGGGDEVLARTDLLYDWIQQQITAHGGTGSAGSTGAGVTTGAGGGGGTSCDTCQNDAISGACANQANTCEASSDCINLDQCLGTCGDQTCVDNCVSQYPNGVNLLQAFFDCICNSACVSECATECGSSSSTTTGAGAGTTTGVGVGVGVGSGVGVGVGSGASTGVGFPAGVGGGSSQSGGVGGAGGGLGLKNGNNSGDDGGCSLGTGSDSSSWGVALLGLALAAAARRRRR